MGVSASQGHGGHVFSAGRLVRADCGFGVLRTVCFCGAVRGVAVMRDRIVAAVEGNGFAGAAPRGWSEALADTLIGELGLRVERVGTLTRWVSDWKADDE